jgi:hypothetical protein
MSGRLFYVPDVNAGNHLMRDMQTEETSAEALERQQLGRQLERDESGEVRDRLFGELHSATQDIETALARKPDAAQMKILPPLLQAVKLSQDIIFQMWDSFHGSAARR